MLFCLLLSPIKAMLPTTSSVLQLQRHETPPARHPETLSLPARPSQAHPSSKPLRLATKASHAPPLVWAEHK